MRVQLQDVSAGACLCVRSAVGAWHASLWGGVGWGYRWGEANLVGADDEGESVSPKESLGHVRPEADAVRPAVRRPRDPRMVLLERIRVMDPGTIVL